MEKKILDLPLKKEWYTMIDSGVKTEEYRELKPYWCNRLLYFTTLGVKEYWEDILRKTILTVSKISFLDFNKMLIKQYGTRGYTHVRFRYGYTKKTMLFEIKSISIGKGNKEWGAPDDDVFIIKLGEKIDESIHDRLAN